MFGLGKNKKYEKIANNIGVLVHQQIKDAMESEGEVFRSPEEMAFTYSYLYSFFWEQFHFNGCDDEEILKKNIKQTCDRVIPNRLWEIYQRGEGLYQLALSNNGGEKEKKVLNAYEKGYDSGTEDSIGIADNVVPSNLFKYLTGQ